MQLDISGMREEVGAVQEFALRGHLPREEAIAPEAAITGPVEVRGKVRRLDPEVLVEGEIEAPVEFTCSRCLGPFTTTLHIPYEQEFIPASQRREFPAGEGEEVQVFDGDALELAASVAETVLLALPVKPLCREDCRGLCPQCGQNLNEGPCQCDRAPRDPRFAGLRQLLEEWGGKGENG